MTKILNLFLQKSFRRRFSGMLLGNLILGMGIAIFKFSNLGNDPFSGMNMSFSDNLNIQYGIWLVIFNTGLFIIEYFTGKKYIGAGTIVNWFFLGFIVDIFYPLYINIFGTPSQLIAKLFILIPGIILIGLGVSLYQTSDMGISPYDSLAIIGTDKFPLPYFWTRIIFDSICVFFCFITGGLIGIGTLITALCLGPVVSIFNKTISEKLIPKKGTSH